MRFIKKHSTAILTLVLILVINSVLSFALVPPSDSGSLEMWKRYEEADSLNSIYVGSSLCYCSFDDDLIDSILDENSLNMGTNAQALSSTYTAIETAIREKKITRVTIGFGYYCMQKNESVMGEVAFYRAKSQTEKFPEKFIDTWNYLTNKNHFGKAVSLNYFIPWIYNHCEYKPGAILENIKAKDPIDDTRNSENINQQTEAADTGTDSETSILNYNAVSPDMITQGEHEKWDSSSENELSRICKLCNDNDVELIIIQTPRPDFYIPGYGIDQYFSNRDILQKICGEYNVEYYDYNLAKPDLFDSQGEYYIDQEHLSESGKEEFSKSYAKLIKLKENGADISSLFYDKDEFLATLNEISCVNFTTAFLEDDYLTITATAYAGPSVKAEYQFEVYNDKKQSYEIIQDYLSDNTCYYKYDDSGSIRIRVNARNSAGKDNDEIRYYGLIEIRSSSLKG